MVTIPSEALFAPSEGSKMPFGRLRPIGLELTSEAKSSFNDFAHMSIAVEAVIRGNGRSGNSQVPRRSQLKS